MNSRCARNFICWAIAPEASLLPKPAFDADLVGPIVNELGRAWQLLPLTINRFADWLPSRRHGEAGAAALFEQANAVRLYSELLTDNIAAISDRLTASKIAHVFLKGSALRHALYADDAEQRCGEDIDLAVGKPDLQGTAQLLGELGFQPAQWNEESFQYVPGNPVLRALVESQHYELGFLVSRQRISGLLKEDVASIEAQLGTKPPIWTRSANGGVAANIMVDVHHGLSREISAQAAIDAAQTVSYRSTDFSIPSFGWAMFHAIFKLYWEGVHNYDKGVYGYADITRLAPKMEAGDVALLEQLLAQWQLHGAAYYVLRRLPSDFGIELSGDLARLVECCAVPDASASAKSQNDYGDVWMKLWGLR